MERVARFEKVSPEQFSADFCACVAAVPQSVTDRLLVTLSLPRRATAGSAGYDIFSPFDFTLEPGRSLRIPTGLRCSMAEGWVMLIMPKSGLGFKYRLQLDNTTGVVDQDYYSAENEGHIQIQITNDSKNSQTLNVAEGKAFAQAVFVPFGITEDDDAQGIRTGGFGSTKL